MSRPNKEEFRIDIRGEYVNYYYNIKERNGIEKNVEVFRHCLKTTEDFEVGDLRPASDIHPKLQYTIDHYLTRSDVQRQFDLKNEENLVRNAVGEYITKIEEFVKGRSLINWDVRAGLQGDPHKAALVFMELHLNSADGSVKLSELVSELNWTRQKTIDVMDNFSVQGLVSSEHFGKETLYHIP